MTTTKNVSEKYATDEKFNVQTGVLLYCSMSTSPPKVARRLSWLRTGDSERGPQSICICGVEGASAEIWRMEARAGVRSGCSGGTGKSDKPDIREYSEALVM